MVYENISYNNFISNQTYYYNNQIGKSIKYNILLIKIIFDVDLKIINKGFNST